MSAMPASPELVVPTALDGFELLDVCHRQTLHALGKLSALVSRLAKAGPDAEARVMAAEIIDHFTNVAREHHQDEERHVFPKLIAGGDADIVQAVQRLQQDHHWIEEDWLELAPQLDAVACGQLWYDLDTLREGAEIFVALMHDHMALEESWIYPQARARVATGERLEMGREMAARHRVQRGSKDKAKPPRRPA